MIGYGPIDPRGLPEVPCDSADCNNHATPFQIGIFYAALYIIAVGTGGTKPNISTMGADQFDDFEPRERTQKLSFFNWWMFSIFWHPFRQHLPCLYSG